MSQQHKCAQEIYWKNRPKDHHVFDVLHFIKAAFKKHALDEIKEGDCLTKEAYRYVSLLSCTQACL